MKCTVVQRRLLSMPHPEHVPADLRGHLVHCARCRDWHHQLVLLERHIPLLPIPSSNGKARLLRRLVWEEVETCQTASLATKTHSSTATLSLTPAVTVRRNRSWILGLAAALLFVAVGWLGLQSWLNETASAPSKPIADPLLASLVRRDLRLARASSAGERIEILAAVADDLHGETHALAHAGSEAELITLAKLYEEVVQQGILKQAQALPAAERHRTVARIALRMAETASRVEQLAQEFPARFATPLHAIAATARAAHRQLCALTPEGRV